MTDCQDQREPLPAPNRQFGYRHMYPIAKVLIERGHLPIDYRDKYGFCPSGMGRRCHLTHALTDEDWAAVTDRYILPENIVWRFGIIKDHQNRVQIQGDITIISGGQQIPIEEWMACQDWSDLPADVAEAALANRLDKQ